MAECHPVGFQWVMEAKARGATVIHVDPRFTRTSAVADIHVPLRAGSDIAFLGGIVNHILSEEKYFREYVVAYTNASAILREDFEDTEDLDGLFSDPSTWLYESGSSEDLLGGEAHEGGGLHEDVYRDPTLSHPRCVFQVLKRHFARYTPEMVAEVCGVSEDDFLAVCEALCANSGRERTSAFCYAVGWTQHTVGVQIIRTAAIVQLLLGNIGRPGGGILALRGHATIQGSTDVPTLYNLLPGYLPMPKASDDPSFSAYVSNHQPDAGWWTEFPKYAVSLLKAWWGSAARADNDWCYDYLPLLTGDHSHMTTVADMADGKVRGYFVMGENPVVGSMHGGLQRAGLAALDWLVVRDFAVIETAEFWRSAPECQTEVFFFPAAAHTEKDGTYTNTQRLLQFHHKAVEPSGDRRSELWFMYHLGLRLRALYEGSTSARDRPLLDLTWSYPTVGPHDEPDVLEVLKEINGFTVADGAPVSSFTALRDDGSTACGCWIYSGVFADGVNNGARRPPGDNREWGYAWPADRRMLYNRASADPEGRPWSERKAYVWWDPVADRWTGHDVPDFIVDRPPSYRPAPDAAGLDTIAGDTPFIMQSDGMGWLFAPTGVADGPLPSHYEPQESVIENPLYGQQRNPFRLEWSRPDNQYHRPFGDPDYPFAVTTYRLTEQHTAGGMSRWLPWLAELQPEFFCEVSPELARERGLVNGEWATISTARTSIEARVLVTARIPPLVVGRRRRVVHQIGLPYHWGSSGLVTGDSANELIAFVADPNVSIQESKALTADIQPGRRRRSGS
jgi:formate dehydrogenase major subunit